MEVVSFRLAMSNGRYEVSHRAFLLESFYLFQVWGDDNNVWRGDIIKYRRHKFIDYVDKPRGLTLPHHCINNIDERSIIVVFGESEHVCGPVKLGELAVLVESKQLKNGRYAHIRGAQGATLKRKWMY